MSEVVEMQPTFEYALRDERVMMKSLADPNVVVEFGSSFGISSIYLAAGLRDNGGGILVGSELAQPDVYRSGCGTSWGNAGNRTSRTRSSGWRAYSLISNISIKSMSRPRGSPKAAINSSR